MRIEPRTLKGFRDFLPKDARKRAYVMSTLKRVFESYGFEPLETPALEYEEILTGKYGEEGDKLMYRFEDNGGRRVALRYDQTVPLARVSAQYQNELPFPFKRYQIQPVWRAENTQKGRFREFYQCDVDTVGVDSALADAEILAILAKSYESLGFKNFKILINDRSVFQNLTTQAIIVIDKLKKIGEEKVIAELAGISVDKSMFEAVKNASPTQRIQEIMAILPGFGVDTTRIQFEPTLARGLDYYTGIIIEVEVDEYPVGSVGGGGRYNELVGMFGQRQIPAVGFAFGFDRILEAMEELQLFPSSLQTSDVLVTIFSQELLQRSIDITTTLQNEGINAEIYLDPLAKIEKQLKYADKKGIPYVLVIGEQEADSNSVAVKNMLSGEQKTVPQSELVSFLTRS